MGFTAVLAALGGGLGYGIGGATLTAIGAGVAGGALIGSEYHSQQEAARAQNEAIARNEQLAQQQMALQTQAMNKANQQSPNAATMLYGGSRGGASGTMVSGPGGGGAPTLGTPSLLGR
jgi:hypothetical protein